MADFLGNISSGLLLAITSAVAVVFGLMYSAMTVRRAKEEVYAAKLSVEREYYERTLRELTDKMLRNEARWAELNHLVLDSISAQSRAGATRLLDTAELSPRPFLEALGINLDDLQQREDQVFVLTPFSKESVEEYRQIALTCGDVGLTARRGDEVSIKGNILPHIVKQIAISKLIIANINGRNPNVFYEMGIAQTLGKTVIIVSKGYGDVPFDLRQQQLVLYGNLGELGDKLKDAMLRLFAGANRPMRARHVSYRRRRGADTWHYCRNCSKWPTSGYDEQSSKPTTGELCNECRGKEANGTCTR